MPRSRRRAANTVETDFLIERLDDLHEIRFACQKSGMYAHWLLTDAQGDTFVRRRDGHAAEVGRRQGVRRGGRPASTSGRWLDQSLDALRGRLARTRS